MITREEFYARIDRLDDSISKRFDEVREDHQHATATISDHSIRLVKLESAPAAKPSTTRWATIGTGVGATLYAIGQYVLSSLTTKGDVK